MNPTNDPLIEITPEELECILRDRVRRGQSCSFPKTWEGLQLTSAGRAWYVAEFVQQAKAAQRMDHSELASSWRDRAQAIASAIAQEANADLLRLVADALDGKHPPESPPTAQQRVLAAVNELCAKNPERLPYREELIDAGLRGELISEVLPQGGKRGPIKLPRKPGQGRKPKN